MHHSSNDTPFKQIRKKYYFTKKKFFNCFNIRKNQEKETIRYNLKKKIKFNPNPRDFSRTPSFCTLQKQLIKFVTKITAKAR